MSVKVEFRAEPEQKEAWARAARASSLKFSQWARQALDAALTGADAGGSTPFGGRPERTASVPASASLGESLAAVERGANAGVSASVQPSYEAPDVPPEEIQVRPNPTREPPVEPERVSRPPAAGKPPLAPNCRDAGMHWRIQPGAMCKWCQGYQP